MRRIWNEIKKFIVYTGWELYSSEEHLIYLYETSRMNGVEINNSNNIRAIRKNDKFVSNYYERLTKVFQERGEIGFGYYHDELLVGFFWIRLGGFPEQVGRESIVIPQDYALLHHLVVDVNYRGKGVGKALLTEFTSIVNSHKIQKTIALVKNDNIPSIMAFTSVGFVQRGSISSKKYFGKKFVNINSPGIPLEKESNSEYCSIVARGANFPIEFLSKPYVHPEDRLMDGVFGGRPWLSILTATILYDSIPGILHAVPDVGTPILLPCLVLPGKKFGKLRVSFEPTSFPSSPRTNEHAYREIISSVANISQSSWIESLYWPLPFWLSNDLLEMKLPVGSSIEKINDPAWIIDIEGEYKSIENKFSKTARTYIRQAEKRGVVVCDEPTEDDINDFSNLWLSSFKERKWGGIQYNKLYFFALNKYMQTGASIILAKVDKSVVAGGVFVRDAVGYVYLLGSMDRDYDHYRPMYAVINHVVRKAEESGLRYLNLGGTGGRENLISFKRHWGARPQVTYRFLYNEPNQEISNFVRNFDKVYERILRYCFRIFNYRYRCSILHGVFKQ